jgi:hypothetical protein
MTNELVLSNGENEVYFVDAEIIGRPGSREARLNRVMSEL